VWLRVWGGVCLPVNLNDLTPLEWRPARTDDLPEVFGLLTAIATFDDASQRWSLEELQDWYAGSHPGMKSNAGPGVENRADAPMMLGFDENSLVAAGWNTVVGCAVRLDGAVHPAYRHQGIGRALLRWQQAVAHSWQASHAPGQSVRMLGFSDATLTGKRHLYERHGLRPTRWFIDMLCQFPPPQRAVDYAVTPALGIRFSTLTADLVEATRDAHNEAFAERFGSQALGTEEWAASLNRDGACAELSWVAVDEFGRVIGYALNSVVQHPGAPGLGWTDRLGVRPSHRGRNIARILLARSLDSFHRAGLEAGGIGLDSVDGRGTDLYRLLGYEATDTIIQYELVDPS
jgi:mycothiol synthase